MNSTLNHHGRSTPVFVALWMSTSERCDGTHLEQMRAASPVAHVAAGAPPYLIIHGTLDETVPYEQAELLHRALLAVGADSRLLPIAGGHHNLLEDPDAPYDGQVWYDVAEEAARFFQRQLMSDRP
jgi:dipeptidyl aminopeptidase/acylaminoacyl peptidase